MRYGEWVAPYRGAYIRERDAAWALWLELAGGEGRDDLFEGEAGVELAGDPAGLGLGMLGPAGLAAAAAAVQHQRRGQYTESGPAQQGGAAEPQRLRQLLRANRRHAADCSGACSGLASWKLIDESRENLVYGDF